MNPIPVYPDGDVRYAIEVNRGWFAENGIEAVSYTHLRAHET